MKTSGAIAAGVLFLVACGDDSNDIMEEAAVDETTTTVEETTTTTTEPEPEPDELVIEAGFSSSVSSIGTRSTSAGALVTNPNADLAAYEVEVLFNLLDAEGNIVDSASDRAGYIAPGETVPAAPLQIGFDLDVEPADVEVHVTGEFRDDEGPQDLFGGDLAVLTVLSAEVRQTEFGPELDGQIRNDTDETIEFAFGSCVFLSDGTIVGGESAGTSDRIPPDVTVNFGAHVSVDLEADEVLCRIVDQ
jgi:hypothetical protein